MEWPRVCAAEWTPLEQRAAARALEVRSKAYCPYSGFAVGAAVAPVGCERLFLGVNVENAAYGSTICAERAAICAAISAGYRRFSLVALAGGLLDGRAPASPPVTPCGACRQVLLEFARIEPGLAVLMVALDGQAAWRVPAVDLLPGPFDASSIGG